MAHEKETLLYEAEQSIAFPFSSNFGKGPSQATRLMTVYISRAVVFKDCVIKVVNDDRSMETPVSIACCGYSREPSQ